MRALVLPLAVLAAVALASCGEDTTADGGSSSPGPEKTTSSSGGSDGTTTSPPADETTATTVRYTRSGGLRPTTIDLVFAAGEPPPKGYTRADVERILGTASDPRFPRLHVRTPSVSCCDLYTYDVTITWEDGETRAFRSVDGTDQPALFEKLLRDIA